MTSSRLIADIEFKNEIIRASAGTGKTFQLSNRFLRLIATGVDSATILATTFTRKGAGEILDRIVERLSAAALSDEAACQLSAELELDIDGQTAQLMLSELMRNIHRLQIGTLDAFFYRIAQTFRLELGLPTQWQIVSEQRTAQQHLDSIREILKRDSVVNLLHLITGGDAGRRVADLIRATVRDLYFVYRDSNAEAWDRLPKIVKFDPNRDFSEECERLLSLKYPHKSQLNKISDDVPLILEQHWLAVAASPVASRIASGEFTYYRKPFPDECITTYQLIIEHCRDYLIDSLTRKNTATFAMLDEFGKALNIQKTHSGELRFEDVNRQLLALIQQLADDEFESQADRSTKKFSFRLDHQIEHLLLDEFQDTSIDQWNVLKPFAISTTKPDNKKSFFCVGDLKQAIYGWRGGVAEVFDLVQEQLDNVSEPQPLTCSYRSSAAVIDLVNDVFLNLANYRTNDTVVNAAVHDWGNRFERHTAAKDLPGYCTVEYAADGADGDKSDGARKIELLLTTVERVRQLHQQMPDKSIGVLVRANDLVAELIYMLREAGINASEEGGNPLVDSAAVLTVLAAFTLADHPGDGVARFHLAGSPLAESLGLNAETLEAKVDNQTNANQVSQRLREEISAAGYGALAERLARILTPMCTERELWRLQQLVQEAYHYDRQTTTSETRLRPQQFVDYIHDEFKATDVSAAQIRVMTIHQSKGLEFDVVVLPVWESRSGWFVGREPVIVGRPSPVEPIDLVCRMANQRLRAMLPSEFQAAYDETRGREVFDNMCVLYVALTRAIHATHVVLPFGAKKEYTSSGAVLLSTLRPDLNEKDRQAGVFYQVGDEDWYQTPTQSNVSDRTAELSLPLDAQLRPAKLSPQNRCQRGIRRVSPSSLEGGDTFQINSIFSTLNNSASLRRGTLLHTCFEQIKWLDEHQPNQQQLQQALRQHSVTDGEFKAIHDEFEQLLAQSNVSGLLNRQTYLQQCCDDLIHHEMIFDAVSINVANERNFAMYLDDQLMQGTIDRLVMIYEAQRLIAADVIDYKTDHVDSENLKDKIEFYAPQLNAYRRCVSQLFGLSPESIGCKLLFTATDQIVSLDRKNRAKTLRLKSSSKTSHKPHRPANKNYQMKFWKD